MVSYDLRKRKHESESTSVSVKKQCIGSRSSKADLCARCQRIPWQTLRDERITTDNGRGFMKFDQSHHELRTSTCRMCRLLSTAKPPELDGKKCILRMLSANRVFAHMREKLLAKQSIKDTILLAVTDPTEKVKLWSNWPPDEVFDRGFISVLPDNAQPGRIESKLIDSENIDYELIRNWIDFCDYKHKSRCTATKFARVRSLRGIDCKTKAVVSIPEKAPYIALSYVWGPRSVSSGEPESQPAEVKYPATIEDSIAVVNALGYEYIWVDQYCIDQTSNVEKAELTSMMDRIYANAELTIIAAAGQGATYGLPGVSNRPRQTQSQIELDGLTFLQTPCHASASLKKSTWASRGWTFQEGHLSRRRLVFSDEQVSFQCQGMHCSESVNLPYEAMHASGSHRFSSYVPNAPLQVSRTGSDHQKTYARLFSLLADYATKNLSYSSDTLNAILGVLNTYASDKDPIHHIWGVPLVRWGYSEERKNKWNLRLGWYHEEPTQRNPGFPTWSWTGWKGTMHREDSNYYLTENQFKTEILSDDGVLLSLNDFVNERNNAGRYVDVSPYLHLQAPLTEVGVEYIRPCLSEEGSDEPTAESEKFKDGCYVVLPIKENLNGYSYLYLDDQDLILDDKKLHPAFVVEWGEFVLTLVVMVQKDDHFERVGVFNVPWRRSPHVMNDASHDMFYSDGESPLSWQLRLDPNNIENAIWTHQIQMTGIVLG